MGHFCHKGSPDSNAVLWNCLFLHHGREKTLKLVTIKPDIRFIRHKVTKKPDSTVLSNHFIYYLHVLYHHISFLSLLPIFYFIDLIIHF